MDTRHFEYQRANHKLRKEAIACMFNGIGWFSLILWISYVSKNTNDRLEPSRSGKIKFIFIFFYWRFTFHRHSSNNWALITREISFLNQLFCKFVSGWGPLKCYYDQILDIHFFTSSHTIGVSKIFCQVSIYYEQQNSCFLDLYFREFTAAINFPCSKSGLRIGENDVIFSKIPHGLKL